MGRDSRHELLIDELGNQEESRNSSPSFQPSPVKGEGGRHVDRLALNRDRVSKALIMIGLTWN